MKDSKVVFLSVSESLRGQIEDVTQEGADSFSINPDIPIPVEIPQGEKNFDLNELSWEMIVSGMLRVIAEGTAASGWIDYYRHFVLTLRPSIMGEFTEAAILKAHNGDFDLALEILDALRGLFPWSPVVKLNRALVLEERASLLEKRGAASCEGVASCGGGAGSSADAAFIAAEAAYAEVLELDPPFPDACFNAGFFYLDRKDFCRARECFSRYLEIAEDETKKEQAQLIIKDIDKNSLGDFCFSEACKLVRQGKEEAGMQNIREFIEEHPSVWNGWFVLGWALRRLGRWEDGAAAFGKALELGGSNCDIHNELAICLMESGDLAGARRELETALRQEPENTKIISNMAVLALKNGNPDEAAAFFRAVLELDPEDPVARNFI